MIPVNMLTIQSKGIDILAVIWPSHVLLSKANGIFSFGDPIKLFKVTLGNTLCDERNE